MAGNTGTLTLVDLQAERFQSVAEFGLNKVADVLMADEAAYNRQIQDLFALFADRTSDRLRIAGQSASSEMTDVDEIGTAPTQKIGAGATLGFPLRAKQYNIGWSRRWFRAHTPAEMAEQQIGAQQAHLRGLIRDFKRAIYTVANYTFRDRLAVPQLDLAVKAAVNADSFPIPNGPNGETFNAATHQHFTAAASLAVADILALINTVVEHGHGNQVIVAINVADQAAFQALTGFVPFNRPQVIPATTAAAAEQVLDITRMNDRPIGFLGAAVIWVKPWAIAGYAVASAVGDIKKPLVLRTRDGGSPALETMSEFELYPLQAQYKETEYGFGVWTRTNLAVHQFTNATYVSPTIT